MQSNPRISANLLVILAKILVNLLVKLTKSGQGGAIGAWGSRDDLSIPRPSWACTGAPDQLQGLHLLAEGQGRHAFGCHGNHGAGPKAKGKHQERKTTATPLRLPVDFSDFLGI